MKGQIPLFVVAIIGIILIAGFLGFLPGSLSGGASGFEECPAPNPTNCGIGPGATGLPFNTVTYFQSGGAKQVFDDTINIELSSCRIDFTFALPSGTFGDCQFGNTQASVNGQAKWITSQLGGTQVLACRNPGLNPTVTASCGSGPFTAPLSRFGDNINVNKVNVDWTLVGTPASVCGNNVCDTGETFITCGQDCMPISICGNQLCESSEDSANCPVDCGSTVTCGDNVCDEGEENICLVDCPIQTSPPQEKNIIQQFIDAIADFIRSIFGM